MGLFEAIAHFFRRLSQRKASEIAQQADAVFTKDAAGRAAAYDIEAENLRKDINEFLGALGDAEAAIKQKRERVNALLKDRGLLEQKLNGAVIAYGQFEAKGDQAGMAKAEADGAGFQDKIKKINEDIKTFEGQIATQQAAITRLEPQFHTMKARLDQLPAEKAESIANYVANSKFIEAQQRINGLLTRQQSSPLDAVHRADQQLAAKAETVGRLLGQPAADDDQYLKLAKQETAGADFRALVAARKAEKDAAQGVAPTTTEERPKI
jgi:chromosome segregation ATPase